MDTTEWIIVAIAAAVALIVVAAIIVWSVRRRRKGEERSARLQTAFGPEYDVVVDEHGRRKGEEELSSRLEAHDDLDLQRVPPETRRESTQQWAEIQYRFLDDPASSVREAEQLVVSVMKERGYPVDDVDARANALSVDWPEAANDYRDAHGAFRDSEAGDADLERRYTAVRRYRKVFETLLQRPRDEATSSEAGPRSGVAG